MNSNQNSNWNSSWLYLFFPCFLTRSFGLVQKKYNFRQKTNKVWKKKTRWFSFPKKWKQKNRICVFRSYYSKKNKCINKYREDFFSLICQNCDSNIIESYYYMPTSMPLVVELVWADSSELWFLTKKMI